MDTQGFRELLKTRKLNDAQIEASIALAERFETFIAGHGRPDSATTWALFGTSRAASE